MAVQIDGSQGSVIATSGTYSAGVSIGGTLTYEDVTNIDAVGLITARNGIEIGARPGVAASISVDGNMIVSGISTFKDIVYVADKILHDGDGNTGIRFPAADTITAQTSGSERLRIQSTGQILYSSASGDNQITSKRTNAAGSNGNYFFHLKASDNNDNTVGALGFHRESAVDDAYFVVQTRNTGGSSTERLRITSDGKIGINDNDPERTMDVRGSNCMIQLEGTGGNGRQYSLCSTDDATGSGVDGGPSGTFAIYDDTAGAARLRIDKDGDTHIIGIATAKAFCPSQGQLSHRNLIINGAMRVCQRGSGNSGAYGYFGVDRWYNFNNGVDENPTMYQGTVSSSGEAPWDYGFRKTCKVQNGNQTSGAGTSDQIFVSYGVEASDMANSGWDYTSTSSYITLSFWVRASVAQTYYGFLKAPDGSNYLYPYSFALSANTWTKIVKTIPGHASLTFDDNTNLGLEVGFYLFLGTDLTSSGAALDTWAAYGGGTARTPDHTSTWYTTNNSTFEFTGMQLEVGQGPTPFEHCLYHDDLVRCNRYYQQIAVSGDHVIYGYGRAESNAARVAIPLTTPLRAAPTVTCSASRAVKYDGTMSQTTSNPSVFKWEDGQSTIILDFGGHSSLNHNNCYIVTSDGGTRLKMESELS